MLRSRFRADPLTQASTLSVTGPRQTRCLRAGPRTGVGASASPGSQASERPGDACDPGLALAPDRAARGAYSQESVSSDLWLLRLVSVDSVTSMKRPPNASST